MLKMEMRLGPRATNHSNQVMKLHPSTMYFIYKMIKIPETLWRTRVRCTSLPLARIKIRRQAVQSWHEWGGRSHVPAAADINDAGQLSSYLQIQANGPTDTGWIHNTPTTSTSSSYLDLSSLPSMKWSISQTFIFLIMATSYPFNLQTKMGGIWRIRSMVIM